MGVAWRQSRYDKAGPGGDAAAYINCPMDRGQYEAFVDALLAGPKSEFKDWEHVPYFDGCLPIEVMAERGRETLRHGPMKPVGLTNPHRPDEKPYAVVQLRQDNALGTLWNMVGFQTKLKHGAQTEIFRTIPGLEKAVFARLGGLHRNTFINAPKLLDGAAAAEGRAAPALRRPDHRRRGLCRERRDRPARRPPRRRRAAGRRARRRRRRRRRWARWSRHITGGHLEGGKGSFQPMNINYGLLPATDAPARSTDGRKLNKLERTRAKKRAVADRALADLEGWLAPKRRSPLRPPTLLASSRRPAPVRGPRRRA